MSPMLTIAKREFRSNFDSPLAYVVICISFLVVGFTFFEYRGGFWQVDRATIQRLFEFVPLGLMLIVSVVTMRLVAEERRSGTLEMLITLPVKDSDVIGGKYLGALGLVLVLVLATLIYPLAMFKFPWNLGPLDTGPVLSGYIGLVLFSAASVAIGLLVSSFVESQAVSFFITIFLLAALWFFDDLAELAGSGKFANVLRYLSFQTRLSSFSRGLLDTRDIVYFLSIALLSLVVSFRALERRKWA
ncbi:MAG TPA: ABC transporter permease subunit [Polyangiaceae bacterium]